MKVTVCELKNDVDALSQEWQALVAHVQAEGSELVLLPEMAFSPWLFKTKSVDPAAWEASMDAHDRWLQRLDALTPAVVIGTRPVIQQNKRLNEAFFWDAKTGYRAMHTKHYLPDEEGFWEASWYERGDGDFAVCQWRRARIGFLICTELWFSLHARAYAKQGLHLLACPRATPARSVDKWLAGGRTAAVVAVAFCLSSNFGGVGREGMQWGGGGWIVEPEEGDVLGLTSQEQPFVTVDIDLTIAETAKRTYPRYVRDD